MPALKICRVCLNTNVSGYSLDSYRLRDVYEEITGIKLNPSDGFPHWACYECAFMLNKFHKFKEKCLSGQKVLELMQCSIPISYESVSQINRLSENLNSSFSVVVASKHTKTYVYKYVPKPKKEKKKSVPTVEHIYYETVKSEGDSDNRKTNINEQNRVIKEELITAETDNVSRDANLADNVSINADQVDNVSIDADHADIVSLGADNADNYLNNDDASSDDENIFLDILKKAVNGKNKLVFLDAKNSITDKSKPRKFMRRKKEYLPMEYWKKYRLTEEQAVEEFKQKEHSEKYAKANYKCHLCLKGFSKLDMLIRHVKLKHDESQGSMECRFCHMRFKMKCQLSKHMIQHYAVYHCLRCDMRFHLETSAIFHQDYHNGVIKKCKDCGEEFKHSSTLYTHMRMSHRSAHICNLCGESYVSEAGLAQHSRLKHYDEEATEASTKSTEKNIYCEKCNLKFKSQSAYIRHLSHSNRHTDEIEDVEVKLRNYKGKTPGGTSRKQTKKARKPTTCINCGKHFQTQSACMKHHLSEHPGKTFYSADHRHICEVCGASLAAVSIASHMNRHTREKLYPCDICGMQFISKSSHRRHQVTHTGARPYPCPLCEKRFTQKNSMQLHYRTFHLKQPYPKRNRKRKTDEMPIMESCRDETNTILAPRWRIA